MHVIPCLPIGGFSRLLPVPSPIGRLQAAGLLNERLVAVHLLGAGRREIAALAKAGASVAHCPSVWTNMGIGPRLWLPVKALHRAGVNITLAGTGMCVTCGGMGGSHSKP